MRKHIHEILVPDRFLKKRSKATHHSALLGYSVFLISLIILSKVFVVNFSNVLGYADNVTVADLLKYTNDKRTTKNLRPLKLNKTLSKAAYYKALDMFDKDYWAHVAPDGKEPWDFIINSGYEYTYAGENLAVDFNDSFSIVNAWDNSLSHRANLMNDKYIDIGFAVVDGELSGRKTTLVVQMFGYPRYSKPSTLASNDIKTNEPIDPTGSVANKVVGENLFEVHNFSAGQVLSYADFFNASKFIALFLGLFLALLFAIDGYYIYRLKIYRVSGHTILHILFLAFAIIGIWYTNIGLVL